MIISRAAEQFLVDINRLVDFYEATEVDCKRIVLSKKQSEAMKKIIEARKKGKLYSSEGEIEIHIPEGCTPAKYRGYELFEKKEGRRHGKKDLVELPL